MDTQRFMQYMLKNEIVYSVIVNLESSSIASFGWRYKLPEDDLLSSFYDEERVRGLDQYLEGKVMPQSMRQGQVRCLLCKPKSNVLIGLFYIENRDVAESYKFGKQLNDELSVIIND